MPCCQAPYFALGPSHFALPYYPDSFMLPSPSLIRSLRRRLLDWFAQHRRDLPWRASEGQAGNAYHILLSEIMLQQTQVATVIAYFHRFIQAFPTVESLAAADEQQVLRLWQGLGYYRRARNLHAAAKAIVQEHEGEIPSNVDELLALPGIGRYTAGAIASIAFGQRAPLVDGNVMRLLARLFAIEEPIDGTAATKRLWELAQKLVPAEQPGDFNQAMMEVGATVCLPRGPLCAICPVRSLCEADKRGIAQSLPIKKKKTKPRAVTHHILAIERGGKFLFHQRPAAGLWSNLWQLPTCETFACDAEVSSDDVAAWACEATGVKVKKIVEISTFFHQTTHRSITFVLWRCDAVGRSQPRDGFIWRALDEVDDLPLANPQRMAIERLQ